jgi:hypothetical protein
MACIQWDKERTEAVDNLGRAFLWKGRKEVLGGEWLVTWDYVTLPKKQGALGIKNLHIRNMALMENLTTKLLSTGEGPCFGWLSRWYMQDSIPIHQHRSGDITIPGSKSNHSASTSLNKHSAATIGNATGILGRTSTAVIAKVTTDYCSPLGKKNLLLLITTNCY